MLETIGVSTLEFGMNMPHPVKRRVPKNVTLTDCHACEETKLMTEKRENGFSIVELLVVCVVIGIVASLAVPHLQKALRASENGATFGTMRTVASQQLSFYSQNGRFGRITEINNIMSGAVGNNSGSDVVRGKFVISMSPATPTDAELRAGYTINATRDVAGEGVTYVYQLTQSGEIRQVLP